MGSVRAILLTLLLSTGAAVRAEQVWEKFSGAKAFAHVQKLVEFGPRPAASDALEKSRRYLRVELEKFGWHVSSQTFTDRTPRGAITFANLIATFGEHPEPSFLLCSHYDTKTFDTKIFVGANDSGSSTGLLLEMARVLASDAALATRIELVFFDGEEAFESFTSDDGLYGSRHFAGKLGAAGRKQFRAGMVFDMIGDKSLIVTLPPDSPPTLARNLFAAAEALKLRDHFTYFQSDVTDDHTPLNGIGIPVIDLIDFDYPPWHTAEDTLDKISADSLQIVGRVALYDLVQLELK